jgi:hypothetical protein
LSDPIKRRDYDISLQQHEKEIQQRRRGIKKFKINHESKVHSVLSETAHVIGNISNHHHHDSDNDNSSDGNGNISNHHHHDYDNDNGNTSNHHHHHHAYNSDNISDSDKKPPAKNINSNVNITKPERLRMTKYCETINAKTLLHDYDSGECSEGDQNTPPVKNGNVLTKRRAPIACKTVVNGKKMMKEISYRINDGDKKPPAKTITKTKTVPTVVKEIIDLTVE